MRKLQLKPHYDLIVVGGGIQGCAMLWEAQSRGLNALLVEAADYCSQTSANSLKTIHGGIRYLQTLDFARTIRSAREQETLFKIASHLLEPLPCLLPTEKKLQRSRIAVSAGFSLYNLLKRIYCPDKKLAGAGCISTDELNKLVDLSNYQNITGAGLWYDAQVQHAERLGLAFVKTAQHAGADAFNYLKAESLSVIHKDQFELKLCCQISQQEYSATTDSIIFCTAAKTIENLTQSNINANTYPDFCLAVNLVVNGRYADTAIGLQYGFAQHDSKGLSRLLFAAPWRDKTLFGTWYFDIDTHDELTQKPTNQQIKLCLDEINATYPGMKLNLENISQVHYGLLPVKNGNGVDPGKNLLETDLIDQPDNKLNLFTVIPTKYTTCRAIAQQTIDKLAQCCNQTVEASISAMQPLIGSEQIDSTDQDREQLFSSNVIDQLTGNYGSELNKLTDYCHKNKESIELIPGTQDHIKGQLDYELEYGQVVKLSDFVVRRSYLASNKSINAELLDYCAHRIEQFHNHHQDFDSQKALLLNNTLY